MGFDSISQARFAAMMAAAAITDEVDPVPPVVDAVLDALIGRPDDRVADLTASMALDFAVRHDVAACRWTTAGPLGDALDGVETLIGGTDPDRVGEAERVAAVTSAAFAGGWVDLDRAGAGAGWFVGCDEVGRAVAPSGADADADAGSAPGSGEGSVGTPADASVGLTTSGLVRVLPPLVLFDALSGHAPGLRRVGAAVGGDAAEYVFGWDEPGDASRVSALCEAMGIGALPMTTARLLPDAGWPARYTVALSPSGVTRIAVVDLAPADDRLVQTATQVDGDLDRLAFVEAALAATQPSTVEVELTGAGAAVYYGYRLHHPTPFA